MRLDPKLRTWANCPDEPFLMVGTQNGLMPSKKLGGKRFALLEQALAGIPDFFQANPKAIEALIFFNQTPMWVVHVAGSVKPYALPPEIKVRLFESHIKSTDFDATFDSVEKADKYALHLSVQNPSAIIRVYNRVSTLHTFEDGEKRGSGLRPLYSNNAGKKGTEAQRQARKP